MDGRERPKGGDHEVVQGGEAQTSALDRAEARPEAADGHEKPNEIRIDVRRDATQIHIDYRDNGCGMEEAVRLRIFEPFFTTRRGKGGSGLGMHIVYNLVAQSLRGSIECVSAPGQGALFRIVMPATPASRETGLRAEG